MRFVLLLIPFVATLCTPIYNRVHPSLAGIPFFYWYLLAWVVITSVLTWIVERMRR